MHSHSFITMGSRFYMYIYTYIHIYKKVYMYMCINIYVHINMTSNMLIILGSRLWATVDWITKLKASGKNLPKVSSIVILYGAFSRELIF